MASQDTVSVKYEADLSDLQKSLDKLISENAALKKQVDGITKEYDQMGTKATSDIKKVEKETGKLKKSGGALEGTMQKVGAVMAAAFAVDRLISIGKEMINVTAKFQKYAAVLENTLGSKSEAQQALVMISQFAAKTPFSVDELTSSFVKLANQGFKPTQAEMLRLGDIAASQGKSFDQLTEAIIDAQTGEFERLKEFGIRAKKEGDNVKFTFKEVETQVDFTSSSIQEYILGLGELQGVTGSTAAISATLEGKISNLGDAWDMFLNTMGGETEGIVSSTLDFISSGISGITAMLETESQKLLKIENAQKESAYNQSLYWSDKEIELVIEEFRIKREFLMERYKVVAAQGFTARQKEYAKEFNLVAQEEQALKNVLADRVAGREKQAQVEEKQAEKNREKQVKSAKEAKKIQQGLLKNQFEAQRFRIDLMEDGLDKELLLLNLKFEEEKNKHRANNEALLLIEKKYYQDLADIQMGELQKEIERQEQSQKNQQDFTEKFLQAGEEELWAEIEQQEAKTQTDKEWQAIRLADKENEAAARIAIEQSSFAALNSLGQIFIQDQQRLAEFQKALTLFQIGIDTARAISSVIAAAASSSITPIDLAIKVAAGIGTVLANVAQAKQLLSASNVPAFKDGVIDLQGPGTGTSDSISARLSKGESVMTNKETKGYKSELTAIRSGKFEDLITQKYVMPAVKEAIKQRDTASNIMSSMNLAGMFDDSGIIRALDKNKPATSKDITRLNKDLQKTFKDSAYKNSKFWNG